MRLDLREPPEPNLCKVRLKKRDRHPIRYVELWQLSKVENSNVADENADWEE